MKKAVALMVLAAAWGTQGLLGQEADWTFVDDTRGGREIAVEFRFPDGLDAPAPLVVVGHGFAMQAGDYGDLAAGLVEEGYVVGLVATESGLRLHTRISGWTWPMWPRMLGTKSRLYRSPQTRPYWGTAWAAVRLGWQRQAGERWLRP